jgi:hypothetical protein
VRLFYARGIENPWSGVGKFQKGAEGDFGGGNGGCGLRGASPAREELGRVVEEMSEVAWVLHV